MQNAKKSLIEILDIKDVIVNIVDIGASYLEGEGEAIYKNLFATGQIKVIGFEPSQVQLDILNKRKGPNEIYLPYAIADGKSHTLNICYAAGMTSILEPNFDVLECFHGWTDWAKVIERIPLETKKLDDIDEIKEMDFLKIDIQGGELLALENSIEKLKTCLVIQTEVEFLEMYKNQPLFADVANFLKSQGFIFHSFTGLAKKMVIPLSKADDFYAGLNQILWTDAIFIRDFKKPKEVMNKEQLIKYAIILHDLYSSYDIVLRTLFALDNNYQTNYVVKYTEFLSKN